MDSPDSSRFTKSGKLRQRRRPVQLTRKRIEAVMHYPQPVAAKKLGVCVSVLKKQFYQIMPNMRWPYFRKKKDKAKKKAQPKKKKKVVYYSDEEEEGEEFDENVFNLEEEKPSFQSPPQYVDKMSMDFLLNKGNQEYDIMDAYRQCMDIQREFAQRELRM